jgi:hypothetical protein
MEFVILPTNIYATLSLKKAAEQQNIHSQTIIYKITSCRAAKYLKDQCVNILPDNND